MMIPRARQISLRPCVEGVEERLLLSQVVPLDRPAPIVHALGSDSPGPAHGRSAAGWVGLTIVDNSRASQRALHGDVVFNFQTTPTAKSHKYILSPGHYQSFVIHVPNIFDPPAANISFDSMHEAGTSKNKGGSTVAYSLGYSFVMNSGRQAPHALGAIYQFLYTNDGSTVNLYSY
jgi:hypothetical protein